MTKAVVGVAGMTHLGLVSAASIASRGFETVCFDADVELVARLQRGELPIYEPGLDDLMRSNGARQQFTARIGDLGQCHVIYVAPDVPTDADGGSDTSGLSALIAAVNAVLSPSGVLVVLSQVEAGFTRALSAPPPERRYYQVETLIFGRAVKRATEPERYIIGCANASESLNARLREVLEAFDCPILPMQYESAELAKISINVCLVASISVANMLAELCERIGADWGEIAPALRLDRRIGPSAYLTPGLGIAGGNLERDLATVLGLAQRQGTEADVVRAWLRNSRYRRDWPLRVLHQKVLVNTASAVVGVLGVTYKENTHSIKNSPSVALIRRLRGIALRVYDPAVKPTSEWHDRLTVVDAMEGVCDGADALVIMTPWPVFRSLSPAAVADRLRGRTVIDPWGVLDRTETAAAGLDHCVLGAPLSR